MFEAGKVAEEFVASVRPIADAIGDPDLAAQLRRATFSVSLNLAEGSQREGRDSKSRYRIAAGECAEAAMAIRIARSWRWIDAALAAPALELADRLQAMLWRLRHPRRR